MVSAWEDGLVLWHLWAKWGEGACRKSCWVPSASCTTLTLMLVSRGGTEVAKGIGRQVSHSSTQWNNKSPICCMCPPGPVFLCRCVKQFDHTVDKGQCVYWLKQSLQGKAMSFISSVTDTSKWSQGTIPTLTVNLAASTASFILITAVICSKLESKLPCWFQ